MHICVFYETIKVSNLEQVTERVIPKIQKTATADLYIYKFLLETVINFAIKLIQKFQTRIHHQFGIAQVTLECILKEVP